MKIRQRLRVSIGYRWTYIRIFLIGMLKLAKKDILNLSQNLYKLLKVAYKRIKQLIDRALNARLVAFLLLVLSIFIITYGFSRIYPEDIIFTGEDNLVSNRFISDFYANGGAELLSIAITVIIIEGLNSRRSEKDRKKALFRQAKSRSNDFALDAMDQILNEGLWDDLLEHYLGIIYGHPDLMRVQWAGGVDLEMKDFQAASCWYANLERASLRGANLDGADFYLANLERAVLDDANLERASLKSANLKGASFSLTDLERAGLSYANLKGAMLYKANLKGADLRYANLKGADLRYANLDGANLESTTLPDGTIWTNGTDMEPFTDTEHPEHEVTLTKVYMIREEMGIDTIT